MCIITYIHTLSHACYMLNRYFPSDVEINGSRSHFNVNLITLKGRKSKVYPIYYKRIKCSVLVFS